MSVRSDLERLTYEEWRALPETNRPCEMVEGKVQMPPPPAADHGWIADNLLEILRPYVRSRGLGVVMSAPLDAIVTRQPLRTRQPDLIFLSAERTGIRSRRDLQGTLAIEVPPDLVVEVLSPGEARARILEKLDDYRLVGVRECWIVSPEAETIEVLRLTHEGQERVGLFGVGDRVRSEALPELDLDVAQVFA